MNYLIFDFETVGIDKNNDDGYKPYPIDEKPLPRENYPMEIGLCLIKEDGTIIKTDKIIIQGAERVSPWTEQNCHNISVQKCEREGIPFSETLKKMANMIGEISCTLVAHNIEYDWDKVLLYTAKEMNLTNSPAFIKLNNCDRYCTCINETNKKNKSAYFYNKLKKWMGPKLEKLCQRNNITYDAKSAHDSLYDVEITRQCFVAEYLKCS
tara:strand:+ start:1117 stop:1746 length:630 start_codon:yes stop_codon:yes gene_type:complete